MTRKKIEIVLIEVDGEHVEAKECTKCGEVKALSEYYKDKRGVGNRRGTCKPCENKKKAAYRQETKEDKAIYLKKYRQENKDKVAKYLKENKERIAERNRKYKRENTDITRAANQRRRARKRQLPDTLTAEQTTELLRRGCVLTGNDTDIHIDHFIPLSWGYGGTTIENMIPMYNELNLSKHNTNPFEWVKREDIQQRIDMRKWCETIDYLAELNGMTAQEYEEYVYWCEANKRDLVSA